MYRNPTCDKTAERERGVEDDEWKPNDKPADFSFSLRRLGPGPGVTVEDDE
jgi:hypothetical protein